MPLAAEQVSYRIDRHDRLIVVGDDWIKFALANGGARLLPPEILGSSLWEQLADPTTRQLYHAMVARIRAGAPPIRFRFRCDATDRRRLISMDMRAADDAAVDFRCTIVEEQRREAVRLLDPVVARGDETILLCGWCKLVRLDDDRWVEVEAAIDALDLFEAPALPQMSHGICPSCRDQLLVVIDGAAAGTSITLGPMAPTIGDAAP